MRKVGQLRLVVLLTVILVGLAAALWGAAQSATGGDWGGLALNLGTEMIGAVVIYLLLQRFVGGTEKKQDLIRQMGSPVRDEAAGAAYALRRRGWLRDGSLRGARLLEADLQGASLLEADLQGASLGLANLQGAQLLLANLQGALLLLANLQEASLGHANLQGARLVFANLQEARLVAADLQGASLLEADLQGASLGLANFDDDTILPDGTKWTPDTDMARFTDPEHPDFWRSDNPTSPAYQPKEQE